ncbi:MAG: ZIP family metal transporter [Thermoanaerobaculia bacterium]
MPSEPVLALLLCSGAAASATALGALPFALGRPPGRALVGLADALAGGLMLGAAYLLVGKGLDRGVGLVLAGAAAGVVYTWWIRRYAGLQELDEGTVAASERGYKLILQVGLHSAAEGVAMGVALVLDLRLGIFLALALAIHNVGEGVSLADALVGGGVAPGQAAGLCVAAKVSQPLLALALFALAPALAPVLPAMLGFAAGSLLFLVLTELVPDAYERAPALGVALALGATAAGVVLLEALLL